MAKRSAKGSQRRWRVQDEREMVRDMQSKMKQARMNDAAGHTQLPKGASTSSRLSESAAGEPTELNMGDPNVLDMASIGKSNGDMGVDIGRSNCPPTGDIPH